VIKMTEGARGIDGVVGGVTGRGNLLPNLRSQGIGR